MIHRLFKQTVARLEPIYGEGEASSIARRLFEDGYNIDRKAILLHPEMELSEEVAARIEQDVRELEKERPIQYIVGFEEFMGRRFAVDPSVLIPRQETEELVRMIIRENQSAKRFLDIGTGSGAIAVSLALEIEGGDVTAWDISAVALEIARKNATTLGAKVNFREVDILQMAGSETDDKWDVIVSNPPYVLDSERELMKPNVIDHEPHLALFVEDGDPLVFYRAIAAFAALNLEPEGKLYFEINQRFGRETAELLRPDFENIQIIQDIHGADRMVSCSLKRTSSIC